ncbi:dual specificity protein phosphatase family protein [Pseudomonas sediminis]|uniref:phosphatase domain-containing protein n=1 Tax=Pseudomonas TaxID=286 RepID=UPI000CACF209|nr:MULTISPECIES: dual specificity protein phosphatase family protein [Pseudomonas]MDG9759489.1 dual specificity protein phosphatase family protein [Pseudomonas sediminis]PKQ43043.1 protein-tyrosine-phosphatase [Pseudomonas sp. YY-1]RRV28770.1 protein-tyrosine-phosphatase [Pseudomonas sp. o96-267]
MNKLVQSLRLTLAALVFAGAVLALPLSMAWGATTSPALVQGVRPANWAQPLDTRINLYRMAPDLYRSALPTAKDWPQLQALGVTTVINFYQRGDDRWLVDPRVQQVHLPLRTDRIDDTDVIEVLRSIRQAQGRGAVLIHCKHGQNRTGLIAALYRVIYQNWSKEQALAEMAGGGFGGQERMGDAERYLRDADIPALRSALASGACSTSPWAMCALKDRLMGVIEGA